MIKRKLFKTVSQMMILGIVFLSVLGCLPTTNTKVVFVPEGQPVRIREDIKDAKIYVKDASGNWIAGTGTIYAGWYALPDSKK